MYNLALLVAGAPDPNEKEGIEYDPAKRRILGAITYPFCIYTSPAEDLEESQI